MLLDIVNLVVYKDKNLTKFSSTGLWFFLIGFPDLLFQTPQTFLREKVYVLLGIKLCTAGNTSVKILTRWNIEANIVFYINSLEFRNINISLIFQKQNYEIFCQMAEVVCLRMTRVQLWKDQPELRNSVLDIALDMQMFETHIYFKKITQPFYDIFNLWTYCQL